MSFKIDFWGAAGTVTGSKYLITHRNNKILIDCGLFQGLKKLRLQNWEKLPVPAQDIHALILTHAHIDHSGYIPRLIKEGFRGKIYCTQATKDLCSILLADSGRLMEEEAEFLNRHHRTKHSPALPLFTEAEAQQAMTFFETVPFDSENTLASDIAFQLRYAGHILGAASVLLKMDQQKVFFSGDIGRTEDSLLFSPKPIPEIDYLITESTYGNRRHASTKPNLELLNALKDTVHKKGIILIPAFAVGRAQALMRSLSQLKRQGLIPAIPMYLNSPMAADVSALFWNYHDLHRLSENECQEIGKDFHYVRSAEESKALNEKRGPFLIIAGSGMLTGGRILHHLKAFGGNPNNLILLTGFQASGTRGKALLEHATELKIHGEYFPIKAQVKTLNSFSGHADFAEIIDWFSRSAIRPKKVFITHGEPAAADELRRRLEEKFKWNCEIPERNECVELGSE